MVMGIFVSTVNAADVPVSGRFDAAFRQWDLKGLFTAETV